MIKTSGIKNRINRQLISGIIGVLCLFWGWSLFSVIKDNQLIFPNGNQIFKQFITIFTNNSYRLALITDIMRLLIVIMISFLTSIILLVIYLRFSATLGFFQVLISFFKSLPVVAIIILIMLTFKESYQPLIITYLVVMPIIFQNLIQGVKLINPEIIDELKMVNCHFFKSITNVYLPLIKPFMINSLIQTFGLGFKVLVTAGFICYTKNSLGKIFYDARSNLAIDQLLGLSMVIFLIVIGVEIILNKYQTKSLFN